MWEAGSECQSRAVGLGRAVGPHTTITPCPRGMACHVPAQGFGRPGSGQGCAGAAVGTAAVGTAVGVRCAVVQSQDAAALQKLFDSMASEACLNLRFFDVIDQCQDILGTKSVCADNCIG